MSTGRARLLPFLEDWRSKQGVLKRARGCAMETLLAHTILPLLAACVVHTDFYMRQLRMIRAGDSWAFFHI